MPETSATADVDDSSQQNYYLIYGSFALRSDAREAVKRFINSGFKEAEMLPSGDRFRVYLSKHSNLKDAMAAKEKLNTSYKEAWILKEYTTHVLRTWSAISFQGVLNHSLKNLFKFNERKK